jgi:aminoglycoside/choline kinase family phosphotransferase
MRIAELSPYEDYRFSEEATVVLLEGGSNRKFYRITEKGRSVIVMEDEDDDREFNHFIEIRKYLEKLDLGVPQLFSVDMEKRSVMMEDLGERTLQSAVVGKFIGAGFKPAPTSWETEEEIYKLYCKVIDFLITLQIVGNKRITECGVGIAEFGYEDFRWETQYFKEEFLKKYCQLKIQDEEKLDIEFHELATKLVNEPLFFMHRDFQSQNIILKNGNVRITDFQSARRGLLAYDLVSLLKDCYVVLSKEVRERLILYYLEQIEVKMGLKLEEEEFKKVFLYTGLQRNMQALGAFSHLTLIKRKVEFEQYIPAGALYLRSALREVEEFHNLKVILQSKKLNTKSLEYVNPFKTSQALR